MSSDEQHCDASDPVLEPVSERGLALRARLTDFRWKRLVRGALKRVAVLDHVREHRQRTRDSWHASVRAVAPGLDWSTYLGWRRCLGTRPGPAWERLLAARVTPPRTPVDPEVARAVAVMRVVNRNTTCQGARDALINVYGQERGSLSNATLRRIWKRAGLALPSCGDPSRFEKVEYVAGGGCLAFIGAAALESRVHEALAVAAQEAGRELAVAQGEVTPRSVDTVTA